MLQRDYIMRLIREFMAALQLLLEGDDVERRREQLVKLYEQYIGPYTLYHNATVDEAMRALATYDEGQRLERMEMLAELYYAEADTLTGPDRDFLLDKAFALFSFIERNGRTFSIDRRYKMGRIKAALGGHASSEKPQ